MRIAITGASGLVGFGLVRGLLAGGHEIVALGGIAAEHRGLASVPWRLGSPAPDLTGCDALIHAAFSHLPGRYRGGEGDDPAGFVSANLDGTLELFSAARAVPRVVFLSSRAVYGERFPGAGVDEETEARPGTLYGQVKLAAEQALCGPGRVSLRVTGVFGPAPAGRRHKWQDLFEAFARGDAIAPRIGTEVHAADLAAAVALILRLPPENVPRVLNVSDIVLDRHDLLALYSSATGIAGRLPPRSDPAGVGAMDTTRLRALGWRPGGRDVLEARLREIIEAR